MAVNRNKLFSGIENGAAWDAGVVFNRTNGIPIDKWSVFKTYDDAVVYASSNPVAYPGQLIAVVPETGDPDIYVILENGSLKLVGQGTQIQADWKQDDANKLDYIKNKNIIEDRVLVLENKMSNLMIEPITQDDYDAKVANGTVNPKVLYFIIGDDAV